MVSCIDFHLTHLTTQYNLGAGSIKPNQDSGDEEEEESVNTHEAWVDFLDDNNGVMCLKPLAQVGALGGTKRSLSIALSEFVRQAWSEYKFVTLYFLYLTSISKDNQAEKAKFPGQILGTSQTNWLIPNFSWTFHSSTLTGCN